MRPSKVPAAGAPGGGRPLASFVLAHLVAAVLCYAVARCHAAVRLQPFGGTHAAASVQCVVWSDCTMQGVFMRGHMSGWLPTHPTQCAAGVRLRRMLPVRGLVSSTCGLSLQHNSGLQSFKCPSCKRRWRSCCCWLGRRHHPRPAHASLYVDRPGCGCGSDRLWPHSNA